MNLKVRYDQLAVYPADDAEGIKSASLKALFKGVPHGSKAGSAGAWQFKQALAVRLPVASPTLLL